MDLFRLELQFLFLVIYLHDYFTPLILYEFRYSVRSPSFIFLKNLENFLPSSQLYRIHLNYLFFHHKTSNSFPYLEPLPHRGVRGPVFDRQLLDIELENPSGCSWSCFYLFGFEISPSVIFSLWRFHIKNFSYLCYPIFLFDLGI